MEKIKTCFLILEKIKLEGLKKEPEFSKVNIL